MQMPLNLLIEKFKKKGNLVLLAHILGLSDLVFSCASKLVYFNKIV